MTLREKWTRFFGRCLRHRLAWFVLSFSLFASPLLAQAPAPPATESGNVLLLYSYGHGGRGIGLLDEGLLDTFAKNGFSTNQLFFEYLDLERHREDPQYRPRLREFLERKYGQREIGVVVTIQRPALGFLLNEGRGLAPAAPVITVQAPPPGEVGERRVFSQVARLDLKGTLERAIDLFPGTRRVVFVSGSTEADRQLAAEA